MIPINYTIALVFAHLTSMVLLCPTWLCLAHIEPFRTVKFTSGLDGLDGLDILYHYYH